jgi:hypothetical protein
MDKRECDLVGPTSRVIATVFDVARFEGRGLQLQPFTVGGQPPTSVYLEDRRSAALTARFYAVKVVNGALLKRPFTLATRQPLYVHGSFNASVQGSTNGAQPAALVADAVTILSANWRDERGNGDLSQRPAETTTVNAVIVTGHVPSQGGAYSGGLENLPRLLEDWSPSGQRNLYLNGSLVLLFHSRDATGPWDPEGAYYRAPNRVFRFAPHIGAEAPMVRNLQAGMLVRSAWRTVAPGATE